jgi:hypothetical protein
VGTLNDSFDINEPTLLFIALVCNVMALPRRQMERRTNADAAPEVTVRNTKLLTHRSTQKTAWRQRSAVPILARLIRAYRCKGPLPPSLLANSETDIGRSDVRGLSFRSVGR